MAIALETLVQSEHYKLRKSYNRILVVGGILAAIIHGLAALFSPPYTPHPYQLRERIITAVELPEDIVIPPPPKEISRPELPQEAEISDEASEDETLAPTSYDPFAPPVVPDVGAGGEAEVFVAFDTPPEAVHMVAATYPELVSAVVLEDPPWRDAESDELWARSAEWARLDEERKKMTPEEMLRAGKAENPTWPDAAFAPWIQAKYDVSPKVFGYINEANLSWRGAADKIQCPTLMLTADPELGRARSAVGQPI